MKIRRMYMKVTKDKYELPIACGETTAELARILGITRNAVFRGVKRGVYIKVEWEEEDGGAEEHEGNL